MAEPESGKTLNVKITDEELRGRYANAMRVTHTREEFIVDFINMVPPQGLVSARVITSPGHLKRLVRALATNLQIYEERFGSIPEAPEPETGSAIN